LINFNELLFNDTFDKFKYAPSTQQGYSPDFQEFKKNQDLIFTGCSQTNGEHISFPMAKNGDCTKIWGFQVANHFNLSSINLGLPGESIYRIVQKLFAHFREYGNPKTLLCLFPDPYRLTLPRDNQMLIAQRTSAPELIIETSYQKSNRNAYSKKPHYKEDVISDMVPIWLNMQSILMLEQYCRSSKIKFIYGSWSHETENLIKEANLNNKTYENFLDLNSNLWYDYASNKIKTDLYKDCHLDLKNKYSDIFEFGIDGRHMGIHRHTHIAEQFINEMINHE